MLQFLMITSDNKKVLHVVLKSKDGWRGHVNMLEEVRIIPGRLSKGSRKGLVESWIFQEISLRMNQRPVVSWKSKENRTFSAETE